MYSQTLWFEVERSCPVCPVSSLCGKAMSGRCFEGIGGLDSDDDHADTASPSATAAAAAAHYGAVTAAAIAGSVQGSSQTPRSPWGMSSPGGRAWQAPPAETISVPPGPPTQRGWQSPQASSRGAATMVPKPKIPSTTGAGSSNTAALAAAARCTAAAAEALAELASDKQHIGAMEAIGRDR